MTKNQKSEKGSLLRAPLLWGNSICHPSFAPCPLTPFTMVRQGSACDDWHSANTQGLECKRPIGPGSQMIRASGTLGEGMSYLVAWTLCGKLDIRDFSRVIWRSQPQSLTPQGTKLFWTPSLSIISPKRANILMSSSGLLKEAMKFRVKAPKLSFSHLYVERARTSFTAGWPRNEAWGLGQVRQRHYFSLF